MRSAFGSEPFGRELHRVRDGLAFAELAAFLAGQGLRYGTALLNLPAIGYRETNQPPQPGPRTLTASDLVVLVTRPPLDDPEPPPRQSQVEKKKKAERGLHAGEDLASGGGGRGHHVPRGPRVPRFRSILRSETPLEGHVFATLRGVFEHCSRGKVELSPALFDVAPPEYMDVEFMTRGSGSYQPQWQRTQPGVPPGHTAGYLIFAPHIWEGGPALLAAFGMGGVETLVWVRHLRTKYADDLVQLLALGTRTGLLVGEWEAAPPPVRPVTLDFINTDYTSRVVFRAQAKGGRGPWSHVKSFGPTAGPLVR